MKRYLMASAVVLIFSGGAALAQPMDMSNFNLSVLGGWSSHPALAIGGVHDSVNDGYNVGARLGYDLNGTLPWSGFSLDADYFYNQSDYAGTGGQLGSSSLMGDLIYHVRTDSPFGLYGGGGVGAVHDNLDGTLHGSSTVFGWQAIGGVDYAFRPDTMLFAEYRYQNAHDANIDAAGPVGNTSNNASIGLKFNL